MFLVLFAAEKLSSKIFPLFPGGPKTGENKGFFVCFVAVCFGDGVFPHGVLMLVFLFMYLLRCKCVIRLCCLIFSFWFFCFPLCFFFGGGRGNLSFYINHFNGPAPMTKKTRSNHRKPQYLKFCFWCSALGSAPSHFHLAHIITVTLNPPPLKIVFLYFIMFLILLKCLFLQCFLNINQICPPNRPLTKTITLHNAQNKSECFSNGLLWKMKTFMLTKTHNWKNERNKNKKKGFERQSKTGNLKKKH